jgi:K+-transporting ATPase KdpF subunit
LHSPRLARGCDPMIWLAVGVTLFLFVYLLAALLRPEWF